MAEPRPLTNEEGEVRKLTEKDFAQFVPLSALPAEMQQLLVTQPPVTPAAEPSAAQQPAA